MQFTPAGRTGRQLGMLLLPSREKHQGAKDPSAEMGELILVPVHWPRISPFVNATIPDSVRVSSDSFVRFGQVRFNFSAQEAMRGDLPVALTSMEFKTLKCFVANPFRVIAKDELLNEVWRYDNYQCTR